MGKNILLFMTDQQRYDQAGYAENNRGEVTPNIDRIAAHAHFTAYNDRIPSRSFLPVLRGEVDSHRKFAYSESDFTEERHGDMVFSEVLRKRGGGGKRTNAWRTVVTEGYKYIRYLGYALGEAPYEEFYDLSLDPMETYNRIEDPAYAEQLREARLSMDYVTDHYPAAQMTWATACAADRKL